MDSRPAPIMAENDQEQFIVEALLKRRKQGRRVEYLVKWLGYPAHEATWEPRTTLVREIPAMVKAYDATHAPRRLWNSA